MFQISNCEVQFVTIRTTYMNLATLIAQTRLIWRAKFIDIILFDFQDAAKRSRNNRDRNLANLRTEHKTVSAEKAAKRQEYLDVREVYENMIRRRDETIQKYNDKRQRILDQTRRVERKDALG